MQDNGTDLPASMNLAFAEELYNEYLRDVNSVPPEWRTYFDRVLADDDRHGGTAHGPSFKPSSIFNPPVEPARPELAAPAQRGSDTYLDRLERLIRAFRLRGHMAAHVDPLSMPRVKPPEIEPSFFGFTEADMDRKFPGRMIYHDGELTLREIVERLRNTYCRSIGMQFMHIDNYSARQWLQQRMESTQNRLQLDRNEQLRILTRLTDAVTFEEFIRRKFIGAKSFSLEGAESLIPLLDLAIEKAGEDGIDEIVLGMAHRGRLNVLANIMGKSPAEIFREFEDKDSDLFIGGGDVKYHLGYSTDWATSAGKKIHLSLCFNPSHLEFVNPVVLGRIRAKQDRVDDTRRERGMPLLIHGDAAFIGEGIVQETLNLSQLPGYAVGGTLHVIVNNQIGFTTSSPEGRSTMYASSVAKMLGSPIFHVNGEDPEAVAQCVRLGMDFRRSFKRDVIIDMYCYRRLGHNESDEPSFTQPLLYQAIEKHRPVREGYLDRLLQLGGVTRDDADEILKIRQEHLENDLSEARTKQKIQPPDSLRGIWEGYLGGSEPATDDTTAVPKEQLMQLAEIQTKLPENFHPHPKIQKLIESRVAMAQDKQPVDWAVAESLAFASLAVDGHRIRMTGQDCERGTFSHRHAVFHDIEDGHTYMPLQHLSKDQAPINIHNSPLSEAGVLGFEYGYSLDCPRGLVLWEAQFGDFVNAAQVIIDQFLVSAETKWRRLSSLVLLLPHGFEGMGPEHSSARLERFLQLAACDNIRIAHPTTPAQYFHLLRRQIVSAYRKPLVVMTPKSMLRLPLSTSPLDELATGHFQRAIPDLEAKPEQITRVLLCSGKMYFDLIEHRRKLNRTDVAIVRLEQLYPFPSSLLKSIMAPYHDTTPVVWVQDAPENMGAWHYLRVQFCDKFLGKYPFSGVSRPGSPSPATGSASAHLKEQQKLLAGAFQTD